MAYNKVIYDGNTLIDLTQTTLESADQLLDGITALSKAGELLTGTAESGGMPTGLSAFTCGTVTLSADVTYSTSGSCFIVNHNLGVVPDFFIVYAASNVATTYSMLMTARSSWYWRSSSYAGISAYHGNSTSSVSMTNNSCSSYGVKNLTTTQAAVTTYSSNTSYYWRKGTYKWFALKLA